MRLWAWALRVLLFAVGFLVVPAVDAAQDLLAPVPTYQYAGRYEGEWSAELLAVVLLPDSTPAAVPPASAPARLQGRLVVDVACDGTLTGQAQGQTDPGPALSVQWANAETHYTAEAVVDLVGTLTWQGALADRAWTASGRVDGALDGTLLARTQEGEGGEASASPVGLQQWYAAEVAPRWTLARGAPGDLAGTWAAALDLPFTVGPDAPPLAVRSAGAWRVQRVAVALCPWRGTLAVRGSLPPVARQEETLELTFWPTGDGGVVGEGRGLATVSGGVPGGCQYTGGGPLAVRVVGEERAGNFTLRFQDDDHPQLLLAASCPSGHSTLPHPALSPRLGPLTLPAESGATLNARLPIETGEPAGEASVELHIAPATGATPP
ncbi:MAG: hypothetical protein IRZ14_13095 [Chloroflexi bacterium]|nr:hypothetical protein [Chloroflexota bacterium]